MTGFGLSLGVLGALAGEISESEIHYVSDNYRKPCKL
jgi:hypothetical protein